VYTIEIIEPLGLQAAQRLKTLGYTNVEVRVGDGYHGGQNMRRTMPSSSPRRPATSPRR